jgi:tRNA dimethylallyltransferase
LIYFLTGITASGKSNLAHKLALELGMSILSVDSMAVYKNLNVLTAKPTEVMQAQVRYYGLNIAETTQNFSVVDYLNYLIKEDIPSKSFTEDILAVGGTGLYIKAMIDKYEFKPTDPTIRAELEQLNYDNLLKFHDVNEIPLPETELNKRRLIRNIEDFMLNESKYVFPDLCMPANYVGVFWNHPDYKENIKVRTKSMLETGLLAEIDSLKNPSKTVLQAIGLNESGDIEENINLKTNRLAKKQITWFKKETKIKMLNTSDESVVYKEMMDIINE